MPLGSSPPEVGTLCWALRNAYKTNSDNYRLWPQLLQRTEGIFNASYNYISQGYYGAFTTVTSKRGNSTLTSLTTTQTWPLGYSLGPGCTLAVYSGIFEGEVPKFGAYCTQNGSTHSNTIIAIPTSKMLSSQWAVPLPYDAHLFQMITQISIGTTSFNYEDLESAAAQNVYNSQPWCASYTVSMWAKGILNATCPQTRPYEPILVVPSEVLRSIDTAWDSCSLDIHGLYDPPIPLSTAASVDVPSLTTPTILTSTAATPASSLQQVTASSTKTTSRESVIQSQSTSPGSALPSVINESSATTADGSSSSAVYQSSAIAPVSTISGDDPTASSVFQISIAPPDTTAVPGSPISTVTMVVSGTLAASDSTTIADTSAVPDLVSSGSAPLVITQTQSSTQGPIGAGTETGVGIVETETATLNALSVLSEALGTWTVSRVPSDNTRGSGTFAESSQVSNSAVTTAPDGSALGVTGKYPGTNTQSSSARQSLNSDSALQSQSAASGSTNGLSASAGSILISYHSTTSGGYADASSQAGTTATTRSTSSDGSDPYSSAGPPANRSTKTGIEVSVSGTSRGIESSEYSVPTPITASQTSLPIITTEAVGSTATPTSTVTAKTTSHSGAEKMASVRWLPAIITVLFCFIV
ncbi:hypothetical protein MBLNU459_g4361t1 [Dothideomycetes sp. NU459]